MSRSRGWCFTINNWTSIDQDQLAAISGSYQYLVVGKESGADGTPHLQGYLQYPQPKSLAQMKKILTRAHLEPTKGRPDQAADYCKKDGDYFEDGTCPLAPQQKGAKEKRRWDEIRIAAEEGRIEDIPDDIRFNSPKLIEYHYRRAQKKIKLADTDAQHLWYYGAAGTGKSRKAREDHPDAYLKMCNKWWDDYDSHATVLIEDFDKNHSVLCHHLKIWGDRYPFPAEIKGGKIDIRPGLIIVTSNYHPSDIWSEDQDLSPILRRFKCVKFNKNPFP